MDHDGYLFSSPNGESNLDPHKRQVYPVDSVSEAVGFDHRYFESERRILERDATPRRCTNYLSLWSYSVSE
jgi:hypothetical protein